MGGAIWNVIDSVFIVSGESSLTFYNNIANSGGGAVCVFGHSVFLAEGNSSII